MRNTLKTLTLALAILIAGGTASAQFRVGVRAGLNVNKLHLDNVPNNFDSDNRCGFTAGAMAELTIPLVGINFDVSLMYTRMNSHITAEGENFGSAKDFIQIPINLKYKIGLPLISKIITPYIYTGPDFAFKLGKSQIFKTFQAEWDLGVGVELLRHLQIGAGYSWGINNIIAKV